MSKKKYTLYVDSMLPVQIYTYMDEDEGMEGFIKSDHLKSVKQQALTELERVYQLNKKHIQEFTEKSNAF